MIELDRVKLGEIEDYCGEKFSEDENLTKEELDYMLGVIITKFEKDDEKYKLLLEDVEENYIRRNPNDYEYGY